jgi:hypothetical protein
MALNVVAGIYILCNVASALSIVFANKAVFAIFQFPYPVFLTLIHTAFTMVGTHLMSMVRIRIRLWARVLRSQLSSDCFFDVVN